MDEFYFIKPNAIKLLLALKEQKQNYPDTAIPEAAIINNYSWLCSDSKTLEGLMNLLIADNLASFTKYRVTMNIEPNGYKMISSIKDNEDALKAHFAFEEIVKTFKETQSQNYDVHTLLKSKGIVLNDSAFAELENIIPLMFEKIRSQVPNRFLIELSLYGRRNINSFTTVQALIDKIESEKERPFVDRSIHFHDKVDRSIISSGENANNTIDQSLDLKIETTPKEIKRSIIAKIKHFINKFIFELLLAVVVALALYWLSKKTGIPLKTTH